MRQIHERYRSGLSGMTKVSLIDVNVSQGEIGPYIEVLCENRSALVAHLNEFGIETRTFYPDVDRADYLSGNTRSPNSEKFGRDGLYLPSGPSLTDTQIDSVLEALAEFK